MTIMNTISDTHDRLFVIKCSFLEIYNETIMDLLSTQKDKEKLEIREHPTKVSSISSFMTHSAYAIDSILFIFLDIGYLRRSSRDRYHDL
jgi:Kinesin motor domain